MSQVLIQIARRLLGCYINGMRRKITTTPHDGFLHAIRARPEDDLPRLVYADWLDEAGDPLAQLIRIQCRRARLSPHAGEWEALGHEEAALIAQHREAWCEPIAEITGANPVYIRGVIAHLDVTGSVLVKRANRLLQLAPLVHSLRIRDLRQTLPEIAESPWLERITHLDLSGNSLGSRHLAVIARSAARASLRQLQMNGCELNAVSIAALSDGDAFANLHALHVASNGLGEMGVRGLASLPAVVELDVSRNHLDDAGAAALVTGAAWRLRHLKLSGNVIGNDGAAALANAPCLADLHYLSLAGNRISNVGVQKLTLGQSLHHLRLLNLERNHISDRGVDFLIESPHWRELTYLNVSHNEFGPAAAARLLDALRFSHMQTVRANPHGSRKTTACPVAFEEHTPRDDFA